MKLGPPQNIKKNSDMETTLGQYNVVPETESKNIEEELNASFLSTFEKFKEINSISGKEDLIIDLCSTYENYLKLPKSNSENIFSKMKLNDKVDLTLSNFMFSIAKVAAGYNFPETNNLVKTYFRSINLNQEEENYLMNYLPKHFLGILEGHIQQEYQHSLYTKFDEKTFITRKEDGIIYKTQPENESQIISNWKTSHKLEKIEILNKEEKEKLDSIGPKINDIKKELSDLYVAEYLPDGSFSSSGKFKSEGKLLEYTRTLENEINSLSNLAEFIIKKNNPDIDDRYEKADKLHKENDLLFNEKLDFNKFKEKLVGTNLDSKELYDDYLTFLSEPDIRKFLETDIGFDFTQYNFQEQVYFLNYLKTVSIKKSKEIRAFSENYGPSGMRTFFSISYGGKEMGDKILSLGDKKKLPKETAEKVFAKYGEIIDVANKAEEEIKKLYEKENISPKVLDSVKEHLLKRGAEMLSELADTKDINELEILKELENIKTETMILGSSYLELHKSGEKIPFDQVVGTSVEKISAQNITEEKKEEIIKAYINGRPKETYENEEHLKLLANEFRNDLNKKETNVFNIRFNGEIIAFADFQKIDEDTFHIGGLTFLENVRNSAIAVAVMNSIMKEFSKYNITAEVHSKNTILNMYTRRFGFKIIGEMPLAENAGELYYKIERQKDIKLEGNQEFEKAA